MPIQLQSIGIAAKAATGNYEVDFLPKNGDMILEPKKDIAINDASYRFQSPDPNGSWNVATNVTSKEGQSLLTDPNKIPITVNSTCTALRVEELTEKDKTNLKSYCASHPNSNLCTSRQYCEIFQGQGPNCEKPNVSTEIPKQQCDKWIVLQKPEQDMLEELCKTYPDSDACERFCERSIQSSLCPPKYIRINTKTGQPVASRSPKQTAASSKKSVKGISILTQDAGGDVAAPPPPAADSTDADTSVDVAPAVDVQPLSDTSEDTSGGSDTAPPSNEADTVSEPVTDTVYIQPLDTPAPAQPPTPAELATTDKALPDETAPPANQDNNNIISADGDPCTQQVAAGSGGCGNDNDDQNPPLVVTLLLLL